jgi:hypothetical protein
MIAINLEKSSPECHNQHLQYHNGSKNNPKQYTFLNSLKKVKLIFNSPTADKIEDLQENKSIINKCKMSTTYIIFIIPFYIIILS